MRVACYHLSLHLLQMLLLFSYFLLPSKNHYLIHLTHFVKVHRRARLALERLCEIGRILGSAVDSPLGMVVVIDEVYK